MESVIKSIDKDSPARGGIFGKHICVGDKLVSINGHRINDVLDYKFYSYDSRLTIALKDSAGREKIVSVRKREGQDLGLEFETYLMDRARSCANRCVFCFVDQLPENMRSTLYFKDDDARLSFLQGNYITLTNLSEREIQRIIDLHISPINVSVHSMNPEVRSFLLGNKRGGDGVELIRRFAEAGIIMNCQIVCCPGINDGEDLSNSMRELSDMYPSINSVSIVPVGLTAHRQKLCEVTPFDRGRALETVMQVEEFSDRCMEKYGSRIFFCADEMYIKAGLELPDEEFYEGYPQLENGVGMLRSFITEFENELPNLKSANPVQFTAVTGVAAAPFIRRLVQSALARCDDICGQVFPVQNEFFGRSIDVAGLVTGGDIIRQLSSEDVQGRILIPRNMLRHGDGVFLDDITIEDIEESFDVKVRVVEQDGADFARAVFGY